MSVPAETLMAYVDGELAPEEAHRIEARIAANPDLKAYVEQQLALRRGLHDSFEEIITAPLPTNLLAAVSKPPSLRWRMRRALRVLATRRALIWSGIPAAAALACGVMIGVFIAAPNSADIISAPGGLVARGALSAALTGQLAARPIGISFRDKSGRYCRTFETGGAASLAGVACHQDGAWHIAALAQTTKEEGAGAAYQLSGSAMPDAVRSAVRGMIFDAPLDAAGERKARAHGWDK